MGWNGREAVALVRLVEWSLLRSAQTPAPKEKENAKNIQQPSPINQQPTIDKFDSIKARKEKGLKDCKRTVV